jgi:hypothetical protein
VLTKKISILGMVLSLTILAGCSIHDFRITIDSSCTEFGCGIGVGVEFGFCLPGDEDVPECEDEITPPDPDGGPPPPPPSEIIGKLSVKYGSNYGISILQYTNSGQVKLYENGVYRKTYSTNFQVVGSSQKIANPSQLASAMEDDVTDPSTVYTFKFVPPPVHITTNATAGQTVTLFSKAQYDSSTVKTKYYFYTAGSDGGVPNIDEEYGGPN